LGLGLVPADSRAGETVVTGSFGEVKECF